jgi:hypothetical protein
MLNQLDVTLMVALWQMMDWKGFGRKQAPSQHLSRKTLKKTKNKQSG